MSTSKTNQIRTKACPKCFLCKAEGKLLYQGLQDRLFGAPGEWTLKKCTNAKCGLVWLDPMPLEEDIALAYQTYYTHQSTSLNRKSITTLAYKYLKLAINRVSGLDAEKRAMQFRYLDTVSPGRLLEIGCGSGDYLSLMRSHGWTVEGVEIDSAASQKAIDDYQLTVHQGTTESQRFPSDSFDAIAMNHVIEHVFDPVALVQECFRILKPGGRCVIITPNNESWGHKMFASNWRDLDPPRHIHIFSAKALYNCASYTNFENILITTTAANADVILTGSWDIKHTGYHDMQKGQGGYLHKIRRTVAIQTWMLKEHRLLKNDKTCGEELVLIFRK